MTPSPIAYLALMLFVPLTALVFALLRPTLAVASLMLGAVLFLPEKVAFDPPGLPPLDKLSISALCCLVGLLVTSRKRVFDARVGSGVEVFGLIAVIGTLGVVMTNRDALSFGPTYLPALTSHDVISECVRVALNWLVPFMVGRIVFREQRDVRDLLTVLVVMAILYIPIILVDLRMSPQWHRWVYGFHQHSFAQTVREGGYRPMGFMAHGLALAIFMVSAVLAAWALVRSRVPLFGWSATPWALALSVIVVALKSLGALVYAIVCVPLIWMTRARAQLATAVVVATIVLSYPVMRAMNVFPTGALVDYSARISQERAQSLKFRFDNEDALLERAKQRWMFGWGGFGRARIFNEDGYDVSVVDGAWIGTFGTAGIVGFSALFGMLIAPIFLTARRLKNARTPGERALVAALALIVAVSALDLLPNGLFSHLPLFFAGALAGVARRLALPVRQRAVQSRGAQGARAPELPEARPAFASRRVVR
jgi:hypothetical protein